MKIYISGPITGVDGYMEKFNEAEEALLAAGHEVVNPARVNAALPKNTTHDEYMVMSFCMLDMCDTVFFLSGWQKSKGANMELGYATRKGHTIVFEGGRECRSTQNSYNLIKRQP